VKVLILTSSFPQHEKSHEGIFIFELVRKLHDHVFVPYVLAPHFNGGNMRDVFSGVQIFRFPYFYPFYFERLAYGSGILFNLKRYPSVLLSIVPFLVSEFVSSLTIIAKYKIQMIHTHWLVPQGLIGALFNFVFKIPHVGTVHGSDISILQKNRMLIILCRFIVRYSDMITVNSTYMKSRLELIVPGCCAKIRVIPMGIDPEKFKAPEFIDIKKKFQTEHLVLSVGRLIDLKGTIHLINAMPAVLRQFPDTELLIIGAGPEKETLVNRTHKLGLENRVHFLGIKEIDELPSYYHAADVFVLPSINKYGKTEALGVVLLEAMASGCPVIGSNVGGIPDIIIDGENGFLVPEQRPDVLAERIVQMLSDDSLREQFRENGLIRVREKFSWEKISMDFGEVFDQVLTNYKNKG
jgi:glycosyltransferase involved in cell wall biosynthesis